ncbi:restriction endonuclease [Thermococcus sp.]
MPWEEALIRNLPRETLIESIVELLKRMGFRDYERVQNRTRWGIDVMAIRDDPIAGMEKVVIRVHEGGLASSKDVNVFADIVDKHKADRGIFVSPVGFTKDARTVTARNYRGRIVLWDAEKLVSLFTNYGIEAPKIEVKEEKKNEESSLREFELDAPLLYDFSPEGVMKLILKKAKEKYPIKGNDLKPEEIKVFLSSAYILSWSVEGSEERDKAVVFSKDKLVTRVSASQELSTPVKKALLNDRSKIKATDREILNRISPSESVVLLKETLSKELNVPENLIRIHDRKKVYVPERAEVRLRVGRNRGTAVVELVNERVELELNPLPKEHFTERAKKYLMEKLGEEPEDIKAERKDWVIRVVGKTRRFTFDFKFNAYTGEALRVETLLTDEALRELVKSKYPNGKILGIEKGKKVAIVEVEVPDGIAILEVSLEDGKLHEVRKLPSPEEALDSARKVVEENFPIKELKLTSSRVIEHKFLELELEGNGGKAIVKIDGSTRDVLDYVVEIKPEKARELVKERYPDFEIKEIEGEDALYTVKAENDRYRITVRVSKDGKLIEETDRVLKEKVAREVALKKIKEIDETAELKSLKLENDWVAEFQGGTKVGKLIFDRITGEVKGEEVRFTEVALENSFHEHIRKVYGETELRTERLTHYREQNYIHIKVAGRDYLYYARIDTRTGKIISEDRAPIKGLTAKLKQLQLESKYK